MAKYFGVVLLVLFCGCSNQTNLGRIERIEYQQPSAWVTISYRPRTYEQNKRIVISGDDLKQLKVGDVIKFDDFGFVGKSGVEQ